MQCTLLQPLPLKFSGSSLNLYLAVTDLLSPPPPPPPHTHTHTITIVIILDSLVLTHSLPCTNFIIFLYTYINSKKIAAIILLSLLSSAHSTGEFFLCVIRITWDSIAGGLNMIEQGSIYDTTAARNGFSIFIHTLK